MDQAGRVLVWPKESGPCLNYLLLLICNANCACEWNLCIAFVMQEKCAKNKVNHKTEVKCSFTKGLDLGPILPIDTAWYGYYCFLCIPIIRNCVPLISSCTEMWNVMETNLIAWCLVGSNMCAINYLGLWSLTSTEEQQHVDIDSVQPYKLSVDECFIV